MDKTGEYDNTAGTGVFLFRELSVRDDLQSLAGEIIGSFPGRGIVTINTENR